MLENIVAGASTTLNHDAELLLSSLLSQEKAEKRLAGTCVEDVSKWALDLARQVGDFSLFFFVSFRWNSHLYSRSLLAPLRTLV